MNYIHNHGLNMNSKIDVQEHALNMNFNNFHDYELFMNLNTKCVRQNNRNFNNVNK